MGKELDEMTMNALHKHGIASRLIRVSVRIWLFLFPKQLQHSSSVVLGEASDFYSEVISTQIQSRLHRLRSKRTSTILGMTYFLFQVGCTICV